MGVDILWLMPIFPIGEVNRKGSLGSPYSVKNYKECNPDFGTFEDFDKLVKEAHKLGMHVVLDWVANHTAWDNSWITEHPEYYHHDNYGNIVSPNADWTDVAHLNYSNQGTVEAMIDALKFWVEKFDIDGYRCDMAGLVPVEFWVEARKQVDKVKKCFWLAEWEDPIIHQAFDASYCWEWHNLLQRIVHCEKNVYDIDHYRSHELWHNSKEQYRMSFTSNHDENTWNGNEFVRLGDQGAKTIAAMNYILPTFPLIYSGQEACSQMILPMFDKVELNWNNLPLEDFYRTLNNLKKDNPALWNGIWGGSYTKLNSTDNSKVYSFARVKGDNKVIGVFNLSHQKTEVYIESELLRGNYENVFNKEKGELNCVEHFIMEPWEYKIYVAI